MSKNKIGEYSMGKEVKYIAAIDIGTTKIVAIVGDGHIEGLNKILERNKIEIETIRLKDLLENAESRKNEIHFTVEYETF